ncbi:hypothetical protein AYI68_g1712 [Smittium mucronatum]|uniref:Uncharacterized protein n=1 Tax=Smittium mucronatum TaxID=133383 RepID=A0A1R0H4V2_9FUNG|nr:hypothetical protein AYI68_g1712 [Smittium mucronatum]
MVVSPQLPPSGVAVICKYFQFWSHRRKIFCLVGSLSVTIDVHVFVDDKELFFRTNSRLRIRRPWRKATDITWTFPIKLSRNFNFVFPTLINFFALSRGL